MFVNIFYAVATIERKKEKYDFIIFSKSKEEKKLKII
jgi:hypothetical protein